MSIEVFEKYKLPTALSQLITAELAYQYHIVPVNYNGVLSLKTSNKNTVSLKNELEIVLGKQVELLSASEEEINQYLRSNYRQTSQSISEKLHYSDDFLMKILVESKSTGSSDIHLEVFEENAKIRYRIDGKLIEKYVITLSEYPVIVNRIKIMAAMDISEKRLPQDGRISINLEEEEFDIRVSTLPTLHGEKVVLRILSKDNASISLEALGFTKSEIDIYRRCVKKPNGIILISGPTGSGKTTTLYATLKELNTKDTNILTIEDPIEYTLKGINQVQLKESIGLDFPNTLRTFLRQDPDIIMVGEIRDVKTANMAIRAALTGHLVLSTIHTNSAWATISRLIDMGIPQFLIASTLNLSVAQRLVRKLCPKCKQKTAMNEQMMNIDFNREGIDFHYKAIGCEVCYYTGYQGRKAIYELLPLNEELETMIKNNATSINEYVKNNHLATLKSNALELIKNGETSIDEVYSLLNE